MKLIILLLSLTTFLLSQELLLDNLLKKYEDSEELYLQTKKESAGHLIVFSRSDLDQMQAYTLNDVLKTLRMFNLQVKNSGMTTLVKSGNAAMSNNPVKIYINSHELNSATLGNALTQYGKMSLYFIDHIEVYQAGNSVVFGNEPGTMIIKLYTKEPSKENGASSQLSLDTKASLQVRALDAQTFGEYSYLASIDLGKNNYEIYTTPNDYELSRDGYREQFFLQFSKKDSYDIEVGATHEDYDSFAGLGKAPTGGQVDSKNIYLHLIKEFENELVLKMSASYESLNFSSRDDVKITLTDATTPNYVESEIGTNTYNMILEKRFINGANDLFIGTNIKYEKFSNDTFEADGIEQDLESGPTELTIYMAYLENLYNINTNNLIALSAKLDHYENDFDNSSTENILRVGYVTLIDKDLTLKFFAMQSYMYPTFLQTTFAPNYNINPDLESTQTQTVTAEAIYNINDTTITVGGGGSHVDNAIVYNMQNKQYVNNPEEGVFKRVYSRVEHKFNLDNKLTVEYYHLFKEKYFSPEKGGLIQLFNKVGKVDIYNELVFRSAYTSLSQVEMHKGYDYSLGIIYPISRKMELKLKGENLLDMASEVPIDGVDIPVVQRRAILTMEYIF